MANPRQRRKAKSSAHKAISHSKRAKRLLKKMPAIRGPKALQDGWDPSKTLCQNYLALGLVHNLNPIPSGGSKVNKSGTMDQIDTRQPHITTTDDATSSVSEGRSVASALTKNIGRIIRDSSGNIVRVELPNDREESTRELVVDAPVKLTESDLRIWAHDHPTTWQGSGSIKGTIVQERTRNDLFSMGNHCFTAQALTNDPVDLENLAACATARERHVSLGERLYLGRLVKKYGDDLEKMARDWQLNPIQRTSNELKRAIAKAGGFGALRQCTDVDVTE